VSRKKKGGKTALFCRPYTAFNCTLRSGIGDPARKQKDIVFATDLGTEVAEGIEEDGADLSHG
jgi:hypothetical protein